MPASYWAPSTSAGRCCFGSCRATTSSHRSITSCSSASTHASVHPGCPGELDRAVKNTERPFPGARRHAGGHGPVVHAAPMRRRARTGRAALIVGLAGGGVLAARLARARRRRPDRALSATGDVARKALLAALGARSTAAYAGHRARLATVPAAERAAIESASQLQT